MDWLRNQDALFYGLLLLAVVMIVVPRLLGDRRGRLVNTVLSALAGVTVIILRPLHIAGWLFFVLAAFWFLRYWFARDPAAGEFVDRDDAPGASEDDDQGPR